LPEREPAAAAQNDWLLWQLVDSAFPSGAFAHSGGLEAAVQQGELGNSAQLEAMLRASLCQFAHGSLPFMTATYDHPEKLSGVDSLCDRFLSNHVANRASRLQGQALLASAARIFARPGLERISCAGREPLPAGHLAPVFGFVLRELGVARLNAARLFLFLQLRGLVSAAIRLGLVGPLQGQAVQHRVAVQAESILARCHQLSTEEVAQTAPLLDLWQANQDRLYSRLFQS